MSKVICDICGTSYPDTADQCPICGSAKPENPEVIAPDTAEMGAEDGYTYVKGGRFSKNNVRKRGQGVVVPAAKAAKPEKEPEEEEDSEDDFDEEEDEGERSNTGLIVVIVILLLAIIAVAGYLYFRYFAPAGDKPDETKAPISSSTAATTSPDETTVDTTPQKIACTGITLSESAVTLTEKGNAWLLDVTAQPENTTDTVTFVSNNPAVATVTDQGRIVAVGAGEAVITITCGDITKECKITCDIAETPTTEPTSEPTTEPTAPPTDPVDPDKTISLKKYRGEYDFTLRYDSALKEGERLDLYNGTVDRKLVTFTSSNTSVATFTNGRVVATGIGITKVHAEYNGQKISCLIRVKEREPSTTEPTTESTTPPTTEPTTESTTEPTTKEETYQVRGADMQLVLDDVPKGVVYLIRESDDKKMTVTWKSGNTSVCTVSGNTVTAVGEGETTVTCTYEGKTYTCHVRVSKGLG